MLPLLSLGPGNGCLQLYLQFVFKKKRYLGIHALTELVLLNATLF